MDWLKTVLTNNKSVIKRALVGGLIIGGLNIAAVVVKRAINAEDDSYVEEGYTVVDTEEVNPGEM